MTAGVNENPLKLLNHAEFAVAAASSRQWPSAPGSEVAFAGRSNVGKSSAINAITRRKGLARTSKTPGRTQQIVFFELGGGARLVDLPGYGYAKVPDKLRMAWAHSIEHYLTERGSLKGLILLMDARHPLTDLDRRMLAWCEPGGLPVHILLTKTDKLGRSRARESVLKVARFTSGLANGVTVQQFSALKLAGVEEAQKKIIGWLLDRG